MEKSLNERWSEIEISIVEELEKGNIKPEDIPKYNTILSTINDRLKREQDIVNASFEEVKLEREDLRAEAEIASADKRSKNQVKGEVVRGAFNVATKVIAIGGVLAYFMLNYKVESGETPVILKMFDKIPPKMDI